MRNRLIVPRKCLLVLASISLAHGLRAQLPASPQRPNPGVNNGDSYRLAQEKYLQLPLAFEKQQNGGNDEYVSRGQGYTFALQGGKAFIGLKQASGSGTAVSLEFAGGRTSKAVPGEELPGKVNLIYGNDPKKWQLGLPTYGRVTYRDVYPGTDVVYYGNQSQLEFDLVLKPGADPDAIRMKIGGSRKLSVDAAGALVIGDGELRVELPKIYQEVDGTRKNISGHYTIRGRDEVAFQLDSYDRNRALVIDPAVVVNVYSIVYSGLLGGGTNSTIGQGIALDSGGNIYVTGYTYAADFPTSNAFQAGLDVPADGFVTKINAAGTALIYSTYIGGSSSDVFQAIAVDSTGAAWVTGYTQSSDFPLLNAAQSTLAGSENAVVARFNAAGALQFSTFLGGSPYAYAYAIAVDSSSNGYVTGYTYGGSFPTTPGVLQTASGASFVTKYGPGGTISYSTLLGGGSTYAQGIAADSSGDAYVTGYTYDGAFTGAPAGGAQASNKGNGDAFVAKLNPTATGLVYFTFLGGTNFDLGKAITLDSGLNAYVAGYTTSTGLATPGAAQTVLAGGQNGFIARLNAGGTAFTYVSYLGGNRQDSINGIALDNSGNAYVAGQTNSNVFPLVSAVQTLPGNGTSLFQTANSGAGWSVFDSNIPGAVFDISQDPGTPSTLVVSTGQGIYRTTNGGTSWTSQSGPSNVYLSRSPASPGTIHALGGNNAWQSTDDGLTWTFMGYLPSCCASGILADPLQANVAYAFGGNLGVYITTNGGTAWSAASGLPSSQVQAMAAGSDGSVYAAVNQFGIYKTTNQGGTWTAINTGLGSFIYPGQHSIAVSPSNPAVLYFAWGAVYESTNGGASWSYLSGVPNASVYEIAVSATNSSVVYAASSNGQVFVSSNGGATWTPASEGLTALSLNEIVVDPTNAAHVFAVATVVNAGFVAELNSSGTNLIYSTYLGGQSNTYAYGVATNGTGTTFVTGYAAPNQGFPVTSTAFGSNNSYSAFVTSIATTTAACSFAVSPRSAMASEYGGTLTFGVVAPSGCQWTASSNQSWATISTETSGTGTGNFSVQIAQNSSGATRQASLTIGGQTVIITQADSSCGFSLSQSNFSLGNAGGPLSVNLTTGAGCPWSVTNNYSGAVSITSGASATGSGTINLSVGTNPGLNARTFYLSIGNTQFTITQSGTCTFTFNPVSASFTAAGGPGSIGVTPSGGACTWSASSNVAWITITSGFNGTGNGTVNYTVAPNTGAALASAINIGGTNFQVSQAAAPVNIALGPGGGNLGTFTTGTQQIALGANSGTGTYTWSLISGSLPPGLALRTDTPAYFTSNQQAGLIGVATTPGNYSFTLQVASGGQTATQAFTIRITALNLKDNAIQIADAFVSTAYSYTFTPVGNAGAVTFTPTNTLPAGLTLSSTGVLSGTPTTPGYYNVNFSIFDGTDTVFRGQGLNIYTVNITTPAVLPNGTQGSFYSTTLTASGGAGGYTFSTCCLPPGLTLSGGGAISGIVNGGPGNYNFYINATDLNGASYQRHFALDIVGTPPTQSQIQTYGTFLNDAVEGDTYGTGIYNCCGGTAPYTWTATGLPPSMSMHFGAGVTSDYINPGDAEIWGIPQAAGNYSVQVTLTDVNGASTTQTFPLHVSPLDADYPPNGTIGVPYSTTLRGLGGSGPYTATLLPGSQLPDGITFNGVTHQLSGTPLESGNFQLILKFTDSTSPTSITLVRTVNLNISASSSTTISINNNSNLGPYGVGTAPSFGLSACCVASYTWTLASGNLPPGQTLSPSGVLSGTLTTAGTYQFLVEAAATGNSANAAFRQFTEIVTLTPVSITTGSLPFGNVGTAYNQTLTAAGGSGALTWTLNSFNLLPPGLSLAANGAISGTPSATGQFFFNVTVTDSAGNTNSRGYTINIYAPGAAPPLGISFGTNLGTFTAGTEQIGLGASGGNGSYTWNLVAGSLPPGLALRTDTPSYFSSNQQAGLIGVATTVGTYPVTLKVTSGSQSFTQATSIRITALNVKDNAIQIPDAFVNSSYSYTFTPVGNAAAVTFTPTNTLPAGLTLSSTGVLSGTPTTPGYYNVNFSIFDGTDTVFRGQGLNVYAVNITTPAVLPNGTQGGSYNTTLTASGGAGGYTFTSTCCLPSGLTVSAGGTISGTINNGPGNNDVYVTVTDSNGASYQKHMALDVVGTPPAQSRIGTYGTFFSDPVEGDTYGYGVFECCGGTAPFTWTATGLPPGMSMHFGAGITSDYITPGNAEIWGIPQAAGNYNVTFTVTDATGASTTQTFPLHVSPLDADYPPNGTINVPYSTTVRGLGGEGPYTATLLPGSQLPDGITFNGTTLQLSGTPLESGNFQLILQFTDSTSPTSNTLLRSVNLNINASSSTTISINNNSNLGPYGVGTAPSFGLSACCVASYTWTLAGGNLPPGQTLSPSGVLSGTLTMAGTYQFLVEAAATGNSANAAFRQFTEIVTLTPVSITTGSLPFGNVGTAYNQTLTAAGGTGALTWTLNSFNYLPPGLSLAANGAISGTPSATAQFFFNVTVTDAAGNTNSRGYTINIYAAGAAPPLGVSFGTSLGQWYTGTQQIALGASGGNGTYTWSLVSGSLPPGYALRTDTPSYFNASTQQAGLIGVGTTPGTYNFTLKVTSGSQSVTQATSLLITALNLKDDAISIPDSFVNTPYSYTFTAVGNAGPVTFTSTNTLPPGLTLSGAGVLSGTPTTAGYYCVNFNMSDGVSTVSNGKCLSVYTVNITTPGLLPNGTQGSAYSATLTASGGAGGYVFTQNCCLPSGLTLSSSGTISGTITSGPGLSGFNVTVTDQNGVSYSKNMSIDVVGVPTALAQIRPYGGINDLFYDAVAGDPYGTGILIQNGGTAPFTWTATGLPPGMSIHYGAGVTSQYITPGQAELWGIPQTAGSYNVQLTMTDASGATTTQTFPFNVSELDSDYPPNGTINAPYSTTLRVLGGTGPYTATQLAGTLLPDGLTFNVGTRQLSGTPLETSGSFSLLARFSDSGGNTLTRNLNIYIAGNGSTTISVNNYSILGPYTVGSAPSFGLSACCVPSDTWSLVSGTLPPGQSLSPSGLLSGTLTTAGNYTFLVKVADASNIANVAFRQFIETVTPISISSANLPYGNVGSAYSGTFSATGGTGTLTWTLNNFTYLPPGLTLASNGAVSGTPTATGLFQFSVTVTDQGGHSNTSVYFISIYAAGAAPPLALNFGPNLGPVSVGQLTYELSPSGGTPPYHYSLTPAATPIPGMRVQDNGQPMPNGFPAGVGAFIGVTTTPGTYNSSIRVTDSLGVTFDRPITLTVSPVDILYQGTLPKAVVGTPYSFTFTPYGGSGNYVWAGFNLPAGLSVNSAGQITGTPTAAGNFNFTIDLADAATPGTLGFGYSLSVNPFAIADAPVLPEATSGAAYSYTFNAPGCGTGCAWSVINNSLPSGLTLSSVGVISGTTTVSDDLPTFTIQASGSNGTSQKVFTMIVPPTSIEALSISTAITTSTVVGGNTATGLVVLGGAPPYTWSVQSGSLPTGITIQGPGETLGLSPGFYYLAGRAMQTGTYNFTLQVKDSLNNTVTKAFTWQISPMTVDYFGLPIIGNPLIYNTPYSQQMLVIGGTGNYTSWTTSAPIYPGLTVSSSTGLTTGTPTNTGSNSTLWTVTDSGGNTLINSVSINVASNATTTVQLCCAPAPGTVVQASAIYLAEPYGGTPPYTITALTPLPPGVFLVPVVVGGYDYLEIAPESSGTLTVTLQATDANGVTGVKTYSVVATDFFSAVSGALANGSVGVAYSQPLVAFGGASPVWAVAPGSTLPPGLSLSVGVISGTPTATGNYSFVLTLSDASGSQSFTDTLNISSLAITGPATLPAAVIGTTYTVSTPLATMTAAGGTGLTWTATGLPSGMSITPAGLIIGTPTTTGQFNVTFAVTNGVSPVSNVVPLYVSEPNPTELDYPIAGATLPDATLNRVYEQQLIPDGGLPPYAWSVAAGSALPPGLSLSITFNTIPGITFLAGSPTAVGHYTFSLTATDSASSQVTRAFTLNVTPLTLALNFFSSGPVVGATYSQQLAVSGGTAPYTLTLSAISPTGDTLPPGLTMSSSGLISGTPTGTGSYQFNVTVNDSAGHTSTQSQFLTSTAPSGLYISTGDFYGAYVGHGFQQTLTTGGGSSTYTWSVSAGSLPPGVTIAGSLLSGAVSAAGIYTFTLRATDNANASNFAEHAYTVEVSSMQLLTPGQGGIDSLGLPAGQAGSSYSYQFGVAGGTGPYTFSESSFNPLPPGLTLNSTGLLSGTTQETGVFYVAPIVTDSTGSANQLTYSGAIPLVITPAGKTAPLITNPTGGLPYASLDGPYLFPLDRLVSGGTPPYTWTDPSTTLPSGLGVYAGANGVTSYIGGIPSVPGNSPISLLVSDSGGQTLTVPLGTLTVSPLALTPDSIPPGVVGTPYSVTFVPSGGTAPYALVTAPNSDMPVGLSLNAGVLSGTPSSAGNYLILLSLQDNAGNSLREYYQVTIDNGAGQAPALSVSPHPILINYPQGLASQSVPLTVSSTSGSLPFTLALEGFAGSSLTATSGTTAAGLVNVTLNGASLAQGTYFGLVGASAAGTVNGVDATPVIVTVTAPGPSIYVETPAAGATVSGIVTLSGWALENTGLVGPAGVSTVNVYVDGTQVGSATYGGARADVCTAYPGRVGCPNVGWSYSLDTRTLTSGAHTLKLTAIDTNGISGSNSVTITVATVPYVNIDTPTANAALNGIVPVSGWALEDLVTNGAAISTVQAFVDGTKVGNATYGTPRTDVCASLNRAGCPNVGWTYNLDTTALAGGSHVLRMLATDANNVTGFTEIPFTTAGVLPYVSIDTPGANASLSGIVPISGWSLEGVNAAGPSAVSTVDVYVDNLKVGSATYGNPRADVCAVLPGRLGCPNVGWSYNLDTTSLSAASHVLKIVATDSSGNTGSQQVTFTTAATPFVDIDYPGSNATLSGIVPISGWSLEGLASVGPNAVTKVDVYVDGAKVGSAVYGGARPDVCAALPGRLGCPNVAWNYNLDTGSLGAGGHLLKIVATDSAGNTGSNQVTFQIALLPYVAIESPSQNATLSGVVSVGGWALESLNTVGPNAVTKVDVYVDGAKVGSAVYGGARADVCAVLPNRLGCPNVGWSYNLDTTALAPGTHVLKIVATDSANAIGSNQLNFNIASVQPYVNIDLPAPNATVTGLTPVSGWALEGLALPGTSAVTGVDIYVDGAKVGSATYGGVRTDVCAALPGRPGCPNIGWGYLLDTTALASGSHVLKALATDGNGVTGFSQITINVPSALPYVDIDLPAPNATLTGVVPMSGWALEALNSVGPAAISSMQVFVDGVLNGTATYGSSRPDVCAALPGRLGCPNVGWSYSLDTSTLSSGAHVLKVTATDTLGNTGFSQLNFTTGVQPFVAIDLPQAGATLTGAEPISGWALEGLNSIGLAITGVDVYVDGTKVGSATYGSPRSDVCAALPNRLGCPNVGWSYTLDTTLLTGGTHTLKIVATDTSGNTGFTAVSFSTAVGVLPYIDIDAPINNATLSGIAPISGWALEGLDAVGNSAISTVDVYVDGTKVGSAIYGGARADVCAALPNRPGCPNVAWNYALDTTGLAAGSHVLKVVATDGNGITNFNQVQFNK